MVSRGRGIIIKGREKTRIRETGVRKFAFVTARVTERERGVEISS